MGGGIFNVIEKLLFVSNSPFWFMRTYICLYVAAPIINKIIDSSNTKQLLEVVAILSFIALYIGLAHFDSSLNSGKNVVNFALIYILGASIKKYRLWEKWNKWTYLWIYIGLNLTEVAIYASLSGNIIGEGLFYVFFHYCSPVLIINAMLVLCCTLNLDFKSKTINWLASSSLAIYLIHTLILYSLIAPVAQMIYEYNSSVFFVMPLIFAWGAVVSVGCMFADKLLWPVWKLFGLLVPPLERLVQNVTMKVDLYLDNSNKNIEV